MQCLYCFKLLRIKCNMDLVVLDFLELKFSLSHICSKYEIYRQYYIFFIKNLSTHSHVKNKTLSNLDSQRMKRMLRQYFLKLNLCQRNIREIQLEATLCLTINTVAFSNPKLVHPGNLQKIIMSPKIPMSSIIRR